MHAKLYGAAEESVVKHDGLGKTCLEKNIIGWGEKKCFVGFVAVSVRRNYCTYKADLNFRAHLFLLFGDGE